MQRRASRSPSRASAASRPSRKPSPVYPVCPLPNLPPSLAREGRGGRLAGPLRDWKRGFVPILREIIPQTGLDLKISVLGWVRRKRHPGAASPPASRRRETIPTERMGGVRPAPGPRTHMRNRVRDMRAAAKGARGSACDTRETGTRRRQAGGANGTRWRTTCRMRMEYRDAQCRTHIRGRSIVPLRHGRTCSGHPLPPLRRPGGDARNKSGHDGVGAGTTGKAYRFGLAAVGRRHARGARGLMTPHDIS